MNYERFIVLENVIITEEERLQAISAVAHDQGEVGRVLAPQGLRVRTLEVHPELRDGREDFDILFDPITLQILAAFPGVHQTFAQNPLGEQGLGSTDLDHPMMRANSEVDSRESGVMDFSSSSDQNENMAEELVAETAQCIGHYPFTAVIAAFGSGILVGMLLSRYKER